jgi:hypothetical protein
MPITPTPTPTSRRLVALLAALATSTATLFAHAAPLARADVPDPLKTWIPWAMHGEEALLCPARHDAADQHTCTWPSRLELRAGATGAAFRFEIQVFGAETPVFVPGDAAAWPQDVQVDGHPAPITIADQRPVALLAPGRHVVTGTLGWRAVPQDVQVPVDVGVVTLAIDGRETVRAPDANGRLWLRAPAAEGGAAPVPESLHVARRIEDGVPMLVTTHVELTVAGKPREIMIPAVLLPGFVAFAQSATLPVRLQADGGVVAQARAGAWSIDVTGRSTAPVQALTLPKGVDREEVWSFAGHDELRRVTIAAPAIDPKQAVMPDDWRGLPAWRLRPGETLALQQTARGAAVPNPDRLAVDRQIWLDFDGAGMTFRDQIHGTVSRSSRLELAAPARLGRAAVDGNDQPVTRLAAGGPDGIEVRPGASHVDADSRLADGVRRFGASGWRIDADRVAATLNLPPGWRLLHARGVDAAEGSWVSRWSLWDFFFVLLATFAAGRLFGLRTGVVLGLGLVLSWHLPGAPAVTWLVLLALTALGRALPTGRLRRGADVARMVCGFALAAWLVPFAVTQVRLAIYPALEETEAGVRAQAGAEPAAYRPVPVYAPAPAASVAEDMERKVELAGSSVARASAAPRDLAPAATSAALREIDPQAMVQTGPGVPDWEWQSHALSWQGPVLATQEVSLILLPPAGSFAWRIASVMLLAAALALCLRGSGRRREADDGAAGPDAGPGRRDATPSATATASAAGAGAGAGAGAVAAALIVATLAALAPADAFAAGGRAAAGAPAPASSGADVARGSRGEGGLLEPSPQMLQALRDRLTEPAACAPHCVDIARLAVTARGNQVQLRLEVHAQSDVALPLPGDGEGWHPARVSVDGQPAALRREAGALWVAVPRGVSPVLIEGDAGDAGALEIALPLPVHAVQAQLDGWTLGGLDARGLPGGALTLARSAPAVHGAAGPAPADALPPFVRVARRFDLGLTWTATTTITRDGESRVPLRVHVPLLAGEAVNDESVQVDHGEALVTLGPQAETSFASTIPIAPKLALASAAQPNQVETWAVAVAPLWHAEFAGLAPTQADPAAAAVRRWNPWPGEHVEIAVTRPPGAGGQAFTVDALDTVLRPGLRATEGAATLRVRASQGGNRRLVLPAGGELVSASVDGRPVTTQASAGVVTLALPPGAHVLEIAWREPRGGGLLFSTRTVAIEGDGVNASTTVNLAPGRVVLAVGGPRMGPAVLFWGVVLVLAGGAFVLGRLRLTPLSGLAWFGLALGLAPASLAGAAVVIGWFFALAARRRWGATLARRPFLLMQVALAAWTLVAAGVLFDALRAGLLGYPDFMIVGNGSTPESLRWYADRFHATPPGAWAVSVPVLAWRLAMLAWALWMASALLKWVRWAWGCWSAGGHWRAAPPRGDGTPGPRPSPPRPRAPAPDTRHPAAPSPADSTFEAPPYTLDGDEA